MKTIIGVRSILSWTFSIVDCFAQYTQAHHALLWQKYYKNLEDTLVYFKQ